MAKDKPKSFSFEEFREAHGYKEPEKKTFFQTKNTQNQPIVPAMPCYEGNLGYLYNHCYYDGIDFMNLDKNEAAFKQKNKAITGFQMQAFDFEKMDNSPILLTTQYPGLALGLGYGHGIKALGEFKLGFSFDYTSGLPIIPASTVKGMLRSAFPCKDLHRNPTFVQEKETYIREKLNDQSIDVSALEKEIFAGKDVFFDAVIDSKHIGNNIVGHDSITPHGTNPLRNPTPLLFLKIMSEITIRFEFECHDGLIDKVQKRTLFKKILLDVGIGAKTNVGYGQLKETL